MVSQADLFAAELGPGSITDNEYARLVAKTGMPTGKFSMMDLYRIAGEVPRWPKGKYTSVGPSVEFSDNFDRANGPIGSGWTNLRNALTVSGNTATATVNDTVAIFNGTLGSSQYGKITRVDEDGEGAILVRVKDADNFYMAWWNPIALRWEIYRRLAGALSMVASNAVNPKTNTFSFRAIGSQLDILNDADVVVCSFVDTNHAYGSVGLRLNNATFVDNFEAGNLSAVATTLFTDDFNRVDGALGANWTLIANTIDILTNQARNPVATQAVAFANTVVPLSDCFAQVDVPVSNQWFGVYLRASAGVDTGYFVGYSSALTALRIYKVVAGVLTSLASLTEAQVAPFTLRGEAVGDTISLYINGALKLSVDNAELTGNRCGMRIQNATCRFDNFSMGIVS